MVTAEEHVLAVVDPLAAEAVFGREGASPGNRTRLDHHHAGPGVGQGGCGTQTGAAGADDDHIGGHGVRAGARASTPARIRVFTQVAAAIQARCGRGTRTTSRNTS